MGKKSGNDGLAPSSSVSANTKHKQAQTTAIALANGFLAVPIQVASRSFANQTILHWIYVRKHTTATNSSAGSSSSNPESLPADRTLFMANLPVDTTETNLRDMLASVGAISQVRFRRQAGVEDGEEDEREERGVGELSDEDDIEGEHHQLAKQGKKGKKKNASAGAQGKSRVPQIVPLPAMHAPSTSQDGVNGFLSTSSSAHVVFLDAASMNRALDRLKKGLKWRHTPETLRGLSYLLSSYALSRPSLPSVSTWANSVISLYQYRRSHPLPRRIGVRGVTLGASGELLDEDGFIIVQRTSGKYGRAGASADGGGSVGVAKHGFKENQNKKSTGLQDFYRFQLRERKREELAGLRKRFEEDKAKVQKLKAGRRFKPY
ncbi:uncharacterized protein UMAG_02564 [Mycosarcoma maydis]|uniref:RRM domain-containing protein n=1 Tax=Mycosarcoma maydis TaxID=5270 RepID=A0A0D1DZZ1_MYCMD|nr:uncharacterized protein UMAG_02564 [Ustilago maydis 521]KIS69216.1 hypothetical protein UMAG_02564 [Ustilago maydis 521]|eukprot:XP_011388970.1 hypothetical protein UMAG_02564 [Ustilago maydis 521]